MSRRLTAEERMRSKVTVDDAGCWVFNGKLRGKSYGAFWLDGKERYAHRAAYTIFVGQIPDDGFIHHKCSNRLCCNPEHLQCTTWNDNLAEMFSRQAMLRRIKKLENKILEMGGTI